MENSVFQSSLTKHFYKRRKKERKTNIQKIERNL